MIFEIEPFKGVKEIQFGMSPDQVRASIPSGFKSFKRTPMAEHPCDFFETLGVFVYYDKSAEVEAIEFTEPATVMFSNFDFTKETFQKIISLLSQKDSQLEVESDSFTSYSLGVGGYAPEADEDPNSLLESVIIFKEGYYE